MRQTGLFAEGMNVQLFAAPYDVDNSVVVNTLESAHYLSDLAIDSLRNLHEWQY